MRACLRAFCLVAGSLLVVAPAPAQKREPRVGHMRRVFVRVTDLAGAPILDLTAADFEVNEGGRLRSVLNSSLATTPMRIAIFVDTSDGTANAINQIRAGLNGFLAALPADAEVMFITTGRQVRVRLQPTTDRRKALEFAAGLFPDGGATPLRDAILEVDSRYFRKLENRWPVFLILTGDSAVRRAPASGRPLDNCRTGLRQRRTAAHAVALTYRGGGFPDRSAPHVAQTAGGHFELRNTANGLPARLKALGER